MSERRRDLNLGVVAVALCGPGLPGWAAARPVLAGQEPCRPVPFELDPPAQLSPAERRRAIASVRLALAVGTAAVAQSGLDAASLPVVFAASGADGDTIDAILTALATPAREVSPTRFHNSVHNAPSGYWGVAMQSRAAVTSLSAHDASFAAGLLEAAVQAVAADCPVLLVAYDLPYPSPLDGVRRIDSGFGVALVLRPQQGGALARLRIGLTPTAGAASGCTDPALEALRRGNPAARALPLLVALAGDAAARIRLDLRHGGLDVAIAPMLIDPC